MALFTLYLNQQFLFAKAKVFCEFQKADEKGGMMKWMNKMDELEIKKNFVINWMMNKFGKTFK